jgi:hypothetical protein
MEQGRQGILLGEQDRGETSAGLGPVTVANTVTPNTALDILNLDWREKDLPEGERTKHVHRLHPYLGKYIPQLVEIFLRKYFRPGQTVLDPFAGSGTTLVQANELGINAIGYDISAFNVLLSRAKTSRYDLDLARREILDILDKTDKMTGRAIAQLALWPAGNSIRCEGAASDPSDYLRSWFAPQALAELLRYRDLISQYQHRDVLKIILSRSARSARLTTHFDLDFPKMPQTEPYWCYKHKRMCVPTNTALQFLKRYSLDTIRRLEEFAAVRTNASVNIEHVDSRDADIPPVDGIITSPPYVGLIDYHEQHRYAYELLGLQDRRIAEIGAAAQGASQKAQREYQEAIAQVFRRACAAMPVGGRVIVIAGDRYGLYGSIAELCDLHAEAEIKRKVNRRTGRRSTDFYESVFIWRKIT